jgi:hypothetical protein
VHGAVPQASIRRVRCRRSTRSSWVDHLLCCAEARRLGQPSRPCSTLGCDTSPTSTRGVPRSDVVSVWYDQLNRRAQEPHRLFGTSSPTPHPPTRQQQTTSDNKATIALVHGPFAESASWNPVIERLLTYQLDVMAIAKPLRDLAGDAATPSSCIGRRGNPPEFIAPISVAI